MCLFNKQDVYIGYSIEQLGKVRGILKNEGIKYTYKITNHSAQARRRGHFGSFGINANYERLYTVSVRKKDYEKARYLVNRGLNR